MFGGIVAVVLAVWFHRAGRRGGRSPWRSVAVGLVVYYLARIGAILATRQFSEIGSLHTERMLTGMMVDLTGVALAATIAVWWHQARPMFRGSRR
ncbi:MAG: hypothetical protein U1E83_00740 [Methylotetracoccus sp.]